MRAISKCVVIYAFLAIGLFPAVRADQYEHEFSLEGFNILELREDPNDSPLFSIERLDYKVIGSTGHLKLYISGDLDAIQAHLNSGSLSAQISTVEGSQDAPVSLFIECTCAGSNVTRGYGYITGRSCDDYCPEGVDDQQFYLSVYVIFGPATDLAIGWEPNQLWFFEQQY